jgi:hypothetical protein
MVLGWDAASKQARPTRGFFCRGAKLSSHDSAAYRASGFSRGPDG